MLELVVVLAVVSLALALCARSLRIGSTHAQYTHVVHQVEADLHAARVRAMTSGRTVPFVLIPNERTYSLGGQPRRRLPPTYSMSIQVSPGARSSEVSPGINFYPDGSSSGGRITITEHGSVTLIVIDWLFGAISVQARS